MSSLTLASNAGAQVHFHGSGAPLSLAGRGCGRASRSRPRHQGGRVGRATWTVGAGKSTVLGLLAGEFAPSAGTIRIDEFDIGRLGAEDLSRLRSRHIALVVQGASANLLSYATARENVWFAQHGARQRGDLPSRSAAQLLELFEVGDLADRRVGEIVSWRASTSWHSSAGVASLPRLLLVDEPTSNSPVKNVTR